MTLDQLQENVTANGDVQDSAVLLLGQLGDLIRAAANDPAKIRALADSIDAKKTALADAVVANTPAAPIEG